jgi:hypothetical protein
VVEAAGIKDILSKSLGSSNPVNVVQAALLALTNLRDPQVVVQMRRRVAPPAPAAAAPSPARPAPVAEVTADAAEATPSTDSVALTPNSAEPASTPPEAAANG